MDSIYIFKTKFAKDKWRNGQECKIIKYYGDGMLLVSFLSDGAVLKIYDTELEEKL